MDDAPLSWSMARAGNPTAHEIDSAGAVESSTRRFSVAMCTYNGAAYVEDQLHSIVNGTNVPSQIVVCDDRSTDDTIDVISTFAAVSPVPIEVFVNEVNVGYVRNFEKAVSLCREPIIFLSDQDDVWFPTKAETILDLFEDPAIGGVFSDAELTHSDLTSMGQTMFSRLLPRRTLKELLSATPDELIRFLLVRPIVTGATLAFRRSILSAALPFPDSEYFIHDGWLAFVIASVSALKVLNRPLIQYRQHAAQQMGLPDRAEAKRTIRYPIDRHEHAKFYRELTSLLDRLSGARPGVAAALRDAIAHNDVRLSLRNRTISRPFSIFRELACGRYGIYSSGTGSAVKDLIRPQ